MEADMGTVRTNGSGQDTFYSVVGSASVQTTAMEVGERGASMEETASALAAAWKKKIEVTTTESIRAAARKAEVSAESGGPILPIGSGYQTWNVLLAGPFQPFGPMFKPSKIYNPDLGGFMLAAFWRNPAGPVNINLLMAGLTVDFWAETVNMTKVTPGPTLTSGSLTFGAGFLDVIPVFIPAGTFSKDPGGHPNIYELNFTAQVKGNPVFTSFATWNFDPDGELAIPGITPGIAPGFQYEIPVRFLVQST
jgi:hypothetical protein